MIVTESAKEIIGAIAAAIDLFSALPYVWGIFYGKTRPHSFSWLIWATSMAIALSAQIAGGGGAGTWALAMGVATTSFVFFLSLKLGERRGSRFDWICLLTALLAIPLWAATNDPTWAVLLVTFIDLAGYAPTYRKSWNHPDQELALMWGLAALKFILGIIALQHYSIVTWLYPGMIATANTILVILLITRRRALKISV